jgi:hypothetical protein
LKKVKSDLELTKQTNLSQAKQSSVIFCFQSGEQRSKRFSDGNAA